MKSEDSTNPRPSVISNSFESAFPDVPIANMTPSMLQIKSIMSLIPTNSLEHLICEYDIKAEAYPDKKNEVVRQFKERIDNEYEEKIKDFPNLVSILNQEEKSDFSRFNMSQARRIVHPLNIWQLGKILTIAKKELNSVCEFGGKKLIIVIGATGAGKTTFIQTCLGYTHIRQRDQRKRVCLGVDGNLRQEHIKLKTSRSNQSCTKMVNLYEMSEQILIADTSGLGENRGAQIEISNNLCLSRVMKESKEVTIVFLINATNWGDRGNSIRQYLAEFSSKFSDFEKIKDKIIYVLNGFSSQRLLDLNGDLTQILETPATQELIQNGYHNLPYVIESLIQVTQQLIDYDEDAQIKNPQLILYNPQKTNSKQIIPKLTNPNLNVANISQHVRASFSINCNHVIKQQINTLHKRAQTCLHSAMYQQTLYLMNLLENLSTYLNQQQFQGLPSFRSMNIEQYDEFKDQASLAWAHVFKMIDVNRIQLWSLIEQSLDRIKNMEEKEENMITTKQRLQKYDSMCWLMTKLCESFQVSSMEQIIDQIQANLLSIFTQSPNQKTKTYIDTYSHIFSSSLAKNRDQIIRKQFQNLSEQILHMVEEQDSLDQLNGILVKISQLNDFIPDNEDKYKVFVDSFDEATEKMKKKFMNFIQEKMNNKICLQEEEYCKKLSTYSKIVNQKMNNQILKDKLIPKLDQMIKFFSTHVSTHLMQIIGKKNKFSQKKLNKWWGNYLFIKKIDNHQIKSVVTEIRIQIAKISNEFDQKYSIQSPRKKFTNLCLETHFQDMEFIAKRMNMFQAYGESVEEWQIYFHNTLASVVKYEKHLREKVHKQLENQRDFEISNLNTLYHQLSELELHLQSFKAFVDQKYQSNVQQLEKNTKQDIKSMGDLIKTSIIQECQQILSNSQKISTIYMKMRQILAKLGKLDSIISKYDQAELKATLIEQRKKIHEWIFKKNKETFENIFQQLQNMKQNLNLKNMEELSQKIQNYQKQTQEKRVKEIMFNYGWDCQTDFEKISEQIPLIFQKFKDYIRKKFEVDPKLAKQHLRDLEFFLPMQAILPAFKAKLLIKQLQIEIQAKIDDEFEEYEVDEILETIEIEEIGEYLIKARQMSEDDKYNKLCGQTVNKIKKKISKISEQMRNMEVNEQKKARFLCRIIEEIGLTGQSISKFEQLMRLTKGTQNKKLRVELKKQSEKLVNMINMGWVQPIKQKVKGKKWKESLESLSQYKQIEDKLRSNIQVFGEQAQKLIICHTYDAHISDMIKAEQQIFQKKPHHIDWKQLSDEGINTIITKWNMECDQLQAIVDDCDIVQTRFEIQLSKMMENVRNMPNGIGPDYRKNVKHLKEKLQFKIEKQIKLITAFTDISQLIHQLKDESICETIRVKMGEKIQQNLVAIVEQSIIQKQWALLPTYLSKQLVPYLQLIISQKMKESLGKTMQKVENNLMESIGRIMKKQVSKMRRQNSGNSLDFIKQIYEWMQNNSELFTQNMIKMMTCCFEGVYQVYEQVRQKLSKMEENEMRDQEIQKETQIYDKIKEIVKMKDSSIMESIVNRYAITPNQLDKSIEKSSNIWKSNLHIVKSFSFFDPKFKGMDKNMRDQQLEHMEKIFTSLNKKQLKDEETSIIIRKIKSQFDHVVHLQLATQIQRLTKWIKSEIYELNNDYGQQIGVLMYLLRNNETKKYSFLSQCGELLTQVKNSLMKATKSLSQMWQMLNKDIQQHQNTYLSQKRKIRKKYYKISINSDKHWLTQRIKKLQQLQQKYKLQISKIEPSNYQQMSIVTKKYADEKQEINKKFDEEENEIKKDLIKQEQEQYRKKMEYYFQEPICQFVNNCLQHQKIFNLMGMEINKKSYRSKMEKFAKSRIKIIIKMVRQKLLQSEYKVYSNQFLQEMTMFDQQKSIIWKTRAKQVLQSQIVKQITGLQVDKKIILKSVAIFNKKLNALIFQCCKHQNQNLNAIIQTLKQQIRDQGSLMALYYHKGGKNQAGMAENLLAKIFALALILKSRVCESEWAIRFQSQVTLQQILAALFSINAWSKDIKNGVPQNILVGMKGGEGKNLVIAVISAYLSVCGYNKVFCLFQSSFSSKNNYANFYDFFKVLEVDENIQYGIFHQMAEMKLEKMKEKIKLSVSKKNSFLSNMKSFLGNYLDFCKLQTQKYSALVVTELDALFDTTYYGNIYTPNVCLNEPEVAQFLLQAWNKKQHFANLISSGSRKNQQNSNIKQFTSFSHLLNCYPNLQFLLQGEIVHQIQFLIQNFDFQKYRNTYELIDDTICYRVKDRFIPYYEGLKTMIAYIEEAKRGNISQSVLKKKLCINLKCAKLSYAEIPNLFGLIVGFSQKWSENRNLLGQELSEKYNIKMKIQIPSLVPKVLAEKHFKRVVYSVENYHSGIVKEIKKMRKQGQEMEKEKQSVLVIFKSQAAMDTFIDSWGQLDKQSEINIVRWPCDSKLVNRKLNLMRQEGQIILICESLAKQLQIEENKSQKPLNIIQTYLNAEQFDESYFRMQTFDRHEMGYFVSIVTPEHFKMFRLHTEPGLFNNEKALMAKRKQYQTMRWNSLKNKVKYCQKLHQQNIMELNQSQQTKHVIKIMSQLNKNYEPYKKKPSPIVIAVDGGCSMAYGFLHFSNHLRLCLVWLQGLLKLVNKSFEIKIIVYRNYNSGRHQILEESDFERDMDIVNNFVSRIQLDGGWDTSALQLVYHHMDSIQSVKNLIIFGDKAGNSEQNTTEKKKVSMSIQNDTNLFCGRQKMSKLKAKGVKINSLFWQHSGNKINPYFKMISQESGGKSGQLILNENSLNFFVQFIAGRIIQEVSDDVQEESRLKKLYNEPSYHSE